MTLKKCIVVDLDNTLWGGVVGEEGLSGIQLSTMFPGSAFIAFQQALLDLSRRGIILAVNSKNNPADALAAIRTHPNMILKENHFAAMRINWNDKVSNMWELAQELNISLDSMVFFDDDPANRAFVRAMLPMVEVPELPADPTSYVKILLSLPYFASAAITNEDSMRGNLYVTERLRKEAEKSYPTKEDFLKSLGLELHVAVNDTPSVARLSQLTEKTNQFNASKQPLSEQEVLERMRNSDYRVLHGRLIDRFGDHGIVTLAIIRTHNPVWNIEQFLMSCRVLGRGAEEAFLSKIAHMAYRDHASGLSLAFTKTEKNKPAEEFQQRYFPQSVSSFDILPLPPSWITTL